MTKLDFINTIDYRQALTNPILDIGARFLEKEQYEAFKVCYMSLRIMDDLVDDRKAGSGNITESEKLEIRNELNHWINALEKREPLDYSQIKLLEMINRFNLPIWPWKKFADSMLYDLEHNGFKTFRDYLRYSEGAAIAPGAIFMQVCLENGLPQDVPTPDPRIEARPLAIFSYLVHIIRDFQIDQNNQMNYFAQEIVEQCGVTQPMLRKAASGGKIEPELRDLMKTYYRFTEYYRQKSREMLNRLAPYLKPRYQLSLEVVYNLYLQIFEKIDVQHGCFSTAELLPTAEEVLTRINATIESFKTNNRIQAAA